MNFLAWIMYSMLVSWLTGFKGKLIFKTENLGGIFFVFTFFYVPNRFQIAINFVQPTSPSVFASPVSSGTGRYPFSSIRLP